MEKFNLEEYLANPSRKVVTRAGRAVTRFLCTDAKGYYPIVALVEKSDGAVEEPLSYTKDGAFCLGEKHPCDLFFAPEKHEGWITISKGLFNNNLRLLGHTRIFKTKEDAEEAGEGVSGYIKTIKIEWEEE